jgi:hypothetical protein
MYQQKLEKILYKLKLAITLLFLREQNITPLQQGKIWSGHSLQAFFGKFGVCISITDHNRPVEVIYCSNPIMHLELKHIIPLYYITTYHLRNKSWKPECVLSFNMGWRILVFYPEPEEHWWSICNNNIVLACFNCTLHIINFGYVDYFQWI